MFIVSVWSSIMQHCSGWPVPDVLNALNVADLEFVHVHVHVYVHMDCNECEMSTDSGIDESTDSDIDESIGDCRLSGCLVSLFEFMTRIEKKQICSCAKYVLAQKLMLIDNSNQMH